MKNPSTAFITIFLLLFLLTGCKFSEIFDRIGRDNPDEPVVLQAKMIDNIPVPADAEIVSDEKDDDRNITLRVPASVYNVAQFYRREMKKNGWKGTARNERIKEDVGDVLSFLRFSKEDEEIRVNISTKTENTSEITITISGSAEKETSEMRNEFPMPSCADGSNVTTINNTMTISADCSEKMGSVADFYKKEAPKADWKLNNQNQSDETLVLIFSKESQKALITLVKKDEQTTSVTVQISK